MARPNKHDYSDRHRPKNLNPPIIFSSSICEICHKARGGGVDHARCSRIRQRKRQEQDALKVHGARESA